jgi:hypothetical protein
MIMTLSDLIAQVESNGNPFAIRYEPAHRPAPEFVSRMVDAAKCSEATAVILCCCSFGAYQIMGDELMSLGYPGSPIAYCAQTVANQTDMFNRVLDEKGLGGWTLNDVINDHVKCEEFATKYNGPGNVQDYMARMLSVYHARD